MAPLTGCLISVRILAMLSRNTTKKSSGSGPYFASIKESGPVPLRLGTPLLPICLEQEYHTGEKLNVILP